jgi:hypothetical protein
MMVGREQEGIDAMLQYLSMVGQTEIVGRLRQAYESGGVDSYWEALKTLFVEAGRSPGLIGFYLAYAGQADSAMVYIERAYREHAFPIHVLAVSQWARPLKDDPRYKDVVARLKLDHVKPAFGD